MRSSLCKQRGVDKGVNEFSLCKQRGVNKGVNEIILV